MTTITNGKGAAPASATPTTPTTRGVNAQDSATAEQMREMFDDIASAISNAGAEVCDAIDALTLQVKRVADEMAERRKRGAP